jgi:tRNA(fMet)-specific endonuclease VapC
MEDRIVLIDTSVLIDFFRKKDKSKTFLMELVRLGCKFHISAITEFEIYSGAKLGQTEYWDDFLNRIGVLSFDKDSARVAVEINNELKRHSKQIAIPDLFIAATAISNNISLATLNLKHFRRISNLDLI